MADRKISDLTALTAPAAGDYLPIVDISEVAAASKNKRITIEELFRGVPLGTAAAPAIAIEGDEDTGIYSPGANQLAVATNGTGRLFVDASGRVGVGTSSPTALLSVRQDIGGTIGNYLDLHNNSTYTGDSEILIRMGRPEAADRRVVLRALGASNFTSPRFAIDVNNAERLRIDSSGRVGIGATPSAGQKLHVAVDADGDYAIYGISPGASGLTGLNPDGTNGNVLRWGGVGTNAGVLRFMSGASTERARIDSSGRLLVGTSSSIGGSTLQVAGTGGTPLEISRFQDGNAGPFFNTYKSRSATIGTNTLVADGDLLGALQFNGADGTGYIAAANIRAFVDGTPGANDMPGRLVFSTTADGAASPTERMRITSDGYFKASNDGTYQSGSRHEFRQTASAEFTVLETATNANYASSVHTQGVTRAANSAYTFFLSHSGGFADIEFRLRGDGEAFADGSWTGGGADYAEYFEWSDENPNTEDRRGISVVLDGDKIREALTGEDPIGVISGNPSVVGDSAWNKWSGKYLRDEFGSYLLDGNGERQLNPAYDPEAEYVPREERPEWDCVGLMGKLRIRKGQVTGSRWIKMRDINDSVEEWLVR